MTRCVNHHHHQPTTGHRSLQYFTISLDLRLLGSSSCQQSCANRHSTWPKGVLHYVYLDSLCIYCYCLGRGHSASSVEDRDPREIQCDHAGGGSGGDGAGDQRHVQRAGGTGVAGAHQLRSTRQQHRHTRRLGQNEC
jgi:hypothetical protein